MRAIDYFRTNRTAMMKALHEWCKNPYRGDWYGEPQRLLTRLERNFGMACNAFLLPIQGDVYTATTRTDSLLLVRLHVLTYDEAKTARVFHRIYVQCPLCEQQVPFGRLQQHMTAKDHDDAVSRLAMFMYDANEHDAAVAALRKTVWHVDAT